jgi:hypothetical protein
MSHESAPRFWDAGMQQDKDLMRVASIGFSATRLGGTLPAVGLVAIPAASADKMKAAHRTTRKSK